MNHRIPKKIVFMKDNEPKKAGREQFILHLLFLAQHLCALAHGGQKLNVDIQVIQPAVVKSYNSNMSGVDLLDRVVTDGISKDSDSFDTDSESRNDDMRPRNRRRISLDRSSRRKHAKHVPINVTEAQFTFNTLKCR
ncbi:hypothetical protein HUJ05_003491 [Dendroctonus ponderosae]|nr:hypothetical protein HUJ05_003491 [Dendroctonus ponderosae]